MDSPARSSPLGQSLTDPTDNNPVTYNPIDENQVTVYDGTVDVHRMIVECLGRYDNDDVSVHDEETTSLSHSELPASELEGDMNYREADMNTDGEGEVEDMTNLFEQSTKPLFEGSRHSTLVATLLIQNCFTVFGVTNSFRNEMWKLLRELLPCPNSLPTSQYLAMKYIQQMGVSYVPIHACQNGCCLFRKELQDAKACPKCNTLRYIRNSSTRPVKVLRHFPLIPRLLRMFRCKRLAELNKWHATREKTGEKVECVPDSKAWKHINKLYPEFASSERNIRFGLALDGVNPFSNQSLSHSTWPILLFNYNLPPWLVTKQFFIMLALLIPGKESVTSENIDIYMAPLIEELQILWDGVHAVDVSASENRRHFRMSGMLIWCIHDFPAYGLASGQVTKGYRGCPECGPHVTTRRSAALGKNIYLGHRRYLRLNHPYRRMKRAFDGHEELRPPPRNLSGRDIMRFALQRRRWQLQYQPTPNEGEIDPVHDTGVKRLSALYGLPYWKVLYLRTLNSYGIQHCDFGYRDNRQESPDSDVTELKESSHSPCIMGFHVCILMCRRNVTNCCNNSRRLCVVNIPLRIVM